MEYYYTIKRKAFTMIELVFVIVIMGIIGKFGVEFMAQSYRVFISSNIDSNLQSNSASALEFVASRLQYRIKASTVARETNATITPQYTLLSNYYNATAPILEWIGADIDGFRGDTTPYWSGVIDLNSTITHATNLRSLGTNTTNASALIQRLSNTTATISDAALYFIDQDTLPSSEGWGWDTNASAFDTQTNVLIHPITTGTTTADLVPNRGDKTATNTLSGLDASEFYQLAWSAYAVGINDWNATKGTGTLTLWYNYQPWQGEAYTNGNSATIMENVSSFRFIASSSIVKIQVCVKSDLITNEEYAVCKEKTVY